MQAVGRQFATPTTEATFYQKIHQTSGSFVTTEVTRKKGSQTVSGMVGLAPCRLGHQKTGVSVGVRAIVCALAWATIRSAPTSPTERCVACPTLSILFKSKTPNYRHIATHSRSIRRLLDVRFHRPSQSAIHMLWARERRSSRTMLPDSFYWRFLHLQAEEVQ